MYNLTRQFLGFMVAICFGTLAISQDHVLLRDVADSTTITNATVFSRQSVIGYVFKDELTIIHPFDGQQTAWFWALGYDTVEVVLPLNHNTTIWMSRKQVDLEPVTVSAFPCTSSIVLGAVKGRLQKRIGFSPIVVVDSLNNVKMLYQYALKVESDKQGIDKCWIGKVSLFMPKSPLRQQNTLRVRLYSEQKDKALPGRDLLQETYLLEVVNDGSWYESNLSSSNTLALDRFYLGFEYMPSDSDRGIPPFHGVIWQKSDSSSFYMYSATLNKWARMPDIEGSERQANLAARVELVCPCRD
jgi:hypothetical protein